MCHSDIHIIKGELFGGKLPIIAGHESAGYVVEVGEGVTQVKVESDEVSLRTAAEQLLDKTDEQIIGIGRRILEAHARSVCATMTVESINSDRMALSKKIGEAAVPEFQRLGLQITVFVIKDIKQKAGNHDLQGKDSIPEIQMDVEKDSTQAFKNVMTVEKSGVEM